MPCDCASVAGGHEPVGFPVQCPGPQHLTACAAFPLSPEAAVWDGPRFTEGLPWHTTFSLCRLLTGCVLTLLALLSAEQHGALVCVLAMPGACGAIAGFLCRTCRACPSCFSFLYTGRCSRKHSSSFLPGAAFLCLPLASRVGVVHYQLHCLPACTAEVLQRAITATGSPVQS